MRRFMQALRRQLKMFRNNVSSPILASSEVFIAAFHFIENMPNFIYLFLSLACREMFFSEFIISNPVGQKESFNLHNDMFLKQIHSRHESSNNE